MSTTDGAGVPELDQESRFVQIYSRVSQDTAAYCPLQVSIGDTARNVVHNAVVTLGLDVSQRYSLMEVREIGQEEKLLKPGDGLLERVLLWPPESQKWHPDTEGYYFILQQQASIGDIQECSTDDYDDLCNLPTVTEETILKALRQRFHKLKIYTYASNLLIAINPNKFLPVYYNPKYIKMYEKQPLGKLSPHIFAIADVAFHAMLDNQVNQCIVLHGESCSGKTESSRYLIHCLTALSEKTCSVGLKRTILGAVPVLEAFGNARTSENNNSSRFGKFIQLNYLQSGVIRGAVIEKYLLEKSRLVSGDKSERNYHVFYYLLMGASKDEQEEFNLLKPQDYRYLEQGNLELDEETKLGSTGVQEYKRLQQAMEMVGFLATTKKHIFSLLSAILLLGNVTYTLSEDTKVPEVGPAEVLSTLSDLLKVKVELLIKTLTKKRIVVANTTVESRYTTQEASAARDSMAKSLYSALFDWIILHINHAMLNRRDIEESVPCLSIGILDMFGFENLQKNTFEQLCINYSIEKLQLYINQHIFKREQEDYVSEGITWQNIDFFDNSSCIQLLSEKSVGLFDLLDEESNLPQATDETLLDKLKQEHQDNPIFESSPADLTFVVQHFAGNVKYHIKDFLKENTEHMRPEVVLLLRSSGRAFLHQLVASSPEALFRWGVLRATIRILTVFKNMGRRRAELLAARRGSRKSLKDTKQCNSRIARMSSNSLTLDFSFDRSDDLPLDVFEDIFTNYENRKKSRSGRQKQLIPKNLVDYVSLQHVVGLTTHDPSSKFIFHPHRTTKPPTISTHFQASLKKLMERVDKAEPFFIFCIRSNAEMKELHFDDELVLQQIKHTGIVQMVHVQKSGYSAKYTFKEFFEKFRILLPRGAMETPEDIAELFERIKMNKSAYQIGKTKVFLKERERQLLQDSLNKEVVRRIIILQRWFRSCLIRLHFLHRKDATMIIQRCWREFFEKKNRAATVIQSAWKSSQKRSTDDKKDDANTSQGLRGRDSLIKKGLKRQQNVECSPSRNRDKEKQEGRASPHNLNRPLSVPLDPKFCTGDCPTSSPMSALQCYKDMVAIKKMADKGKEEQSDDSSPEIQRRRDNKNKDFKFKGMSMSADELSKNISSSSDSSPSTNEMPPEIDGSRFSLPARSATEDLEQQNSSSQSQVSTPEKIWFLSRFIKRRSPKYSPTSDTPSNHAVTLPRYSPPQYIPYHNSERVKRNPTIRISRATRVMEANASLDREITNLEELRHLDEFLGNQVYELKCRIKELSPTESVFLTATMQFRETIKEMYSLQKPKIGYKDLMKGYRNKVNTLAKPRNKTEVSLVINLFQSVLDGFIRGEVKRLESEPAKPTKTAKKRKKKDKCLVSPLDHRFSTYQVNIMQSCDLCGSYIWGMEKAYMCSACKFICHKKCLSKIITDCSTQRAKQDDTVACSLHFGVKVYLLTSKANPVPKVMEMLLMHVEINGLYTEGLYRKSGSACRAKELHQILEINPEGACLDNYAIHTVTGLVKRWLRELPDPLMTFDLYSDFLRAVELPEKAERIRAVYQKVDELPPANYNTLERLIFHLVRVAKEEEHNKMTPNSLAIVFAPCVLRSPAVDNPFLSIKDVAKTTLCVEILITEQFRRYKEKMQNIQELEYAEALAVHQLKLRRQNTVVEKSSELDIPAEINSDDAEKTLIERIKSIKQEKEELACRLPDLDHDASDNDNLDSASSMSSDSLDDRLGSVDSEGNVTHTPRPSDLAQRAESLMESGVAPGQKADVTESICFLPSQDDLSTASKPQLTGNTLNGSFDDLDIPYIDENEDEDLTAA